ncbi:hypothetical protein AVEN_242416-1 [Araneus ventricosus]|uniref:Uncharacterized protein n=1 Tax=Araneus ventricosus TaxID=182803 RepID=A0A4Y2WI77_ARAVE|nr:hypothetical protein AVEN_242416-1 [Araneus ventricosus]
MLVQESGWLEGSDSGDSYLHMAPMSCSAPTGPSVYLNLNCSESAHSSSLPPVTQDNDCMEMKSPTEGYINMSPVGATRDHPLPRSHINWTRWLSRQLSCVFGIKAFPVINNHTVITKRQQFETV